MTPSKRRLRKGRVALAVLAGIGLVAGIPLVWSALAHNRNTFRAPKGPMVLNTSLAPEHRVYKYSVVPGGVQSPAELSRAVDRDAVVRDHYQGIYLGQVTKTHLDKDMLAFVSYRVKNKIYWTQNKVHLHKGELVLTDGEHMVRGRCGNRISTSPVISGAGPEPPESQLDTEEPQADRLLAAAPPVASPPAAKDSTPARSAFVPTVAEGKPVPTTEKAASRRLFPVLVPIAVLVGSSLPAGHSSPNSAVPAVNVPASGGSGSNIAPVPDPPSGPPARVPVSAPPPSSGPPVTVAPEPSAYFGLLGTGLGWLVVRSRRRTVRS